MTARRTRAYWVEAPGRGALREELLPEPGAGEVLVEARYGAVSRGTESLVFHGRVPASERLRMRCPHQAGDFPFPVKYGYANVGRVLEGPGELVGRSVFCLYPHQSAYVVPAEAVVPLPDGVPEARAVLGANLETALNALWDARPLLGDRVSIVGAGSVGSLVAFLCRRAGVGEVELVDRRGERAALASALGARFAQPEGAARGRDLVFHASGSADGVALALELAAAEGSVLELSWYGDREVPLALGGRFHSERLTLRSSQVGRLSPHARPRMTHRERLALALGYAADPALDAVIDGECAFSGLPEAMRAWLAPDAAALCRRIRYD